MEDILIELIEPPNLNKCLARIAKSPYSQCTNCPKVDNLCGMHSKSQNIILITAPINKPIKKIIIRKKPDIIKPIVVSSSITVIYPEYDTLRYTVAIIKIQSIWRGYNIRLKINRNGIASFARHLINNDTDFLSFDNIRDIPSSNLFTYRDNRCIYWGFQLATFQELIKLDMDNPYNTLPIDKLIISNFNKYMAKINNNSINIKMDIITDPKVLVQQKCIKVFQKIDNLKQYTKCEWFLELELPQLYRLFFEINDIWNYRVENLDKSKYIPSRILTTISFTSLTQNKNKLDVSNIILDIFDRLVSEGNLVSDRTTASLWVLTALTLVSIHARNDLPWLYQSASHY